ncbi:MAG: DUF4440 domain-containing protein [Methylibium sp.]|nr:DUF4440 domain-containing protein [Methylibium sp.]MBA3625401.1 DUF4440 domain-containing protein [Methylibium sp.]
MQQTIEQLNVQWNAAFNRKDATGLAALYHEKAVVSPGNGQTVVGRAEIQKLFQGFFDAGAHNHTIEVIATGGEGDLIYEVARWNANLPEKDGKKPVMRGILVQNFQRLSGGQDWQSSSHVWNAASE